MKKFALFAAIIFFAGSMIFAKNDLPFKSYETILTQSSESNELIVAFEKLSPKQYEEFELALLSLNGIRKIGSCDRMNIFYFNYDTTMYRTAEEAFEAVIGATKKYQPLMKIGASVADVQKAC